MPNSNHIRSATSLMLPAIGLLSILAIAPTGNAQETAPLGHNQTQPAPLVQENKTIRVSEHVYVIPDGRVNLVPNIGMIVGDRTTLIVDAGMGPRNGQVVVRELVKINKNAQLYLTTTHFHPEHVTGAQAFPDNTIVLRAKVQQEEVVQKQPEFIANFSRRTPEIKALLQDVKPRAPDIVFEHELKLDLGGVTARLFWLGAAHTRGDTFIYVEEDKVLFAGDVVLDRFFPIIPDADASAKNWLVILNQLQDLQPQKVVPGHGGVGDATLITKMHVYLKELESRVAALKAQGKSSKEASQLLTTEFQAKYSDWENPGWIADAVEHFYSESKN
jgi:glyoxylase-like metal-dependent hydrolase (beta-lactamase superfamily II)